MYYANVSENSVDWVAVMVDGLVELYKLTGLKNYPLIEAQTVKHEKTINLTGLGTSASDLKCLKPHGFATSPLCLKFDDRPIFIFRNKFGQLLRESCSIAPSRRAQQDKIPKILCHIDCTRMFPMQSKHKFQDIQVHSELQIMAVLLDLSPS
jgi:hypothetical protein